MGSCVSLKKLWVDFAVRPTIVAGRFHRLPQRIEHHYNLERTVLGTGFNGSVFRATGRRTPGVFAVKCLHLQGMSAQRKERLRMEAEIFLQMDHPNVARLVGVYETRRHLYLVMECLEGGELFDRVKRERRFCESDAAKAVLHMLRAVSYIHSQGVVHRDLKLENFMYESEGSDYLKLIDFGFSRAWGPNAKMAVCVGTLSYMAPEVLRRKYTEQCDMWSLGVIAYILLIGKMPFSGPEDAQKAKILKGDYRVVDGMWETISDPARDFVEKLLVVDPEQRLSAICALRHPWLARGGLLSQSARVEPSIADALCGFAQASRFRRACMLVMAWSLTNQERALVRETFFAMDADRKGTIKLWELKWALAQHFNVTDEQIQPIFEALDATQDGEIHYSEFLAAMVSTHIMMHDDLLSAAFQRFDTKGTGYITLRDLKRVLGESVGGARVEEILADVAPNEDGAVSYEDFISYLKDGAADDDALFSSSRSPRGEHWPSSSVRQESGFGRIAEIIIDHRLRHPDKSSKKSPPGEVLEDSVPDGYLGLRLRPQGAAVSAPCHPLGGG